MGNERRVKRLHDLHRDLAPVDSLEQAETLTKENWRQRDVELVDQACIEVLEDNVGTSRDADILVACNRTCLPQRTLDPVVDEVERGPARALPGTAYLMGQDEDRRMERGFLRPEPFAPVEHAL